MAPLLHRAAIINLQQEVAGAKSGQVGLAVLFDDVEVLQRREVGSRREVKHRLIAGPSC